MLSIQTNKNKNCKSTVKITACKVFCKEYCFHISMGKITACKVYWSHLHSIVQCALPQSILKSPHGHIYVGKLRGTSCWEVSVFIDCSRVVHPFIVWILTCIKIWRGRIKMFGGQICLGVTHLPDDLLGRWPQIHQILTIKVKYILYRTDREFLGKMFR
jgi:hypothetical protein